MLVGAAVAQKIQPGPYRGDERVKLSVTAPFNVDESSPLVCRVSFGIRLPGTSKHFACITYADKSTGDLVNSCLKSAIVGREPSGTAECNGAPFHLPVVDSFPG